MRFSALRAIALSSLFVLASTQNTLADDPSEDAPQEETTSFELTVAELDADSVGTDGPSEEVIEQAAEAVAKAIAGAETAAEVEAEACEDSCGGGDTPGAPLPGDGSANVSGSKLHVYTPTLSELTGWAKLSVDFGFDADIKVSCDIGTIFDPEKFCDSVTVIAEGKVGVPGLPGANLGFEYNFRTQEWNVPFTAEFKTNWGPDIMKLLEDTHIWNK